MLLWKNSHDKKRHVFVASGVRYDLANISRDYVRLLSSEFVSGHLKVAPEHSSSKVLELMGKPGFEKYLKFEKTFSDGVGKAGKQQYVVPYFISSHPGCSEDDALELTEYLVSNNLRLRQVQDFTPVPLTLSTAMYVAQKSPSMGRLYVAKGHKAKKLQAALMQYWDTKNKGILRDYLLGRGKVKLLGKIESAQKQSSVQTKSGGAKGGGLKRKTLERNTLKRSKAKRKR